ncbi:MAG TPA: hypothetical protein VH142_26435 [Polyangiaceae bacterium]|jgi:hypothetical protein|nr:hypothetical protein [Polyangiaceae bacterium]
MLDEAEWDPMVVMRLRMIGGGFGILGVAGVLVDGTRLARTLSLKRSDPQTDAVSVVGDPWFGLQYEISINGADHWCSGGEKKYGTPPSLRVTYSAAHPEICRATDVVGGLGNLEAASVLFSFTAVCLGLAATVLWSRRRARWTCVVIAVLLLWTASLWFLPRALLGMTVVDGGSYGSLKAKTEIAAVVRVG